VVIVPRAAALHQMDRRHPDLYMAAFTQMQQSPRSDRPLVSGLELRLAGRPMFLARAYLNAAMDEDDAISNEVRRDAVESPRSS
jgi:hypothetical protein